MRNSIVRKNRMVGRKEVAMEENNELKLFEDKKN